MDKKDIIILIAIFVYVAVRLYKKYSNKGTVKSGIDARPSQDSFLSSSSKDDDYEPYSGK